jgi:hypothetical protein
MTLVLLSFIDHPCIIISPCCRPLYSALALIKFPTLRRLSSSSKCIDAVLCCAVYVCVVTKLIIIIPYSPYPDSVPVAPLSARLRHPLPYFLHFAFSPVLFPHDNSRLILTLHYQASEAYACQRARGRCQHQRPTAGSAPSIPPAPRQGVHLHTALPVQLATDVSATRAYDVR